MANTKSTRLSSSPNMIAWDDADEKMRSRFLMAYGTIRAIDARSKVCFERNDFSKTTFAFYLALDEKSNGLQKEVDELLQELKKEGCTEFEERKLSEPVNLARGILEMWLLLLVRGRHVDQLEWVVEYVKEHKDRPFSSIPEKLQDVKWPGTLQGAILREFCRLSSVSIESLFLPFPPGVMRLPTKATLMEEVAKSWKGATDNLGPDFYKHIKSLGLSGLPNQTRPRNTI